jgi:XTP/dITP diphosphohydrolase
MEAMKIILSTRNPSKLEQIKAMFTNSSIEVVTLDEAGIDGEALEDGSTLEENAFKKVMYVKDRATIPFWIMADDTGLYINALNGEPGIHAARWAGNISTDDITKHTLQQLEGKIDRSAVFKTVVCLLSPDEKILYFEGAVNGHLAEAPKTKPQPKMPYSPLFSPEGTDKVWAEMTVEEENERSHRGKAFRQVVAFLEKEIE